MKLCDLSIEDASKVIIQERNIDELGRLTLPLKQREFLGWKQYDCLICHLGEDEKSIILTKK